ncbi:MAG: glycosyltransferase family 2 protein [Nitrospiria bacterium]
MLEGIFLCSILFVIYTYFGYPFLLKVVSLFHEWPPQKGQLNPKVSFIITAYNEEKRIEAKLRNTLNLIYPKEKLEVIVASDCSTDRTDEIVRSYQSEGIRLVRAAERLGKENAQKGAVFAATGEILIFTDVATILEPKGIIEMVRNFCDPTVGCVSSVDRFIDSEGKTSGEGAYVKYEMFLRNLESRVNSLVGLSGSFFAARKVVCTPWSTDLQSDFNTLLNARKLGLRGISDPESAGYYRNIADERKEFDRKVRTVLRGISVLMKNRSFLNPFHYGLFSWQMFSHKLCRWLVPFFLITALVSNLFLLSQSGLYKALFALQLLFYGLAILKLTRSNFPDSGLIKIPFYFVMVNLSILMAWYRYLKGEQLLTWEPSQR